MGSRFWRPHRITFSKEMFSRAAKMKVFGICSFCGVAEKATPQKRPTGRQTFLWLVDFVGSPKKATPQKSPSLPQLHYHCKRCVFYLKRFGWDTESTQLREMGHISLFSAPDDMFWHMFGWVGRPRYPSSRTTLF